MDGCTRNSYCVGTPSIKTRNEQRCLCVYERNFNKKQEKECIEMKQVRRSGEYIWGLQMDLHFMLYFQFNQPAYLKIFLD